jgi:hypothetical protein
MDAEVIDQPIEAEVIDQTETQDEPSDSGESDRVSEPTDKVDGRKFNPEWSKALKEMRELYPDRADMLTKLRDGYGRYSALQELAPKGLDDVRGWKTTVDALGGPEAAANLMQRASEIEEMDNRIANADFSVVSELPEEMQKGFYGMLPDALAHLAESDAQRFGEIVQPHFAAALAGTGMGDHLKSMYQAAGDNESLKGQIKQMFDWFTQQTSGKGTITPGARTANPEVQRLQAELESRRQADTESFANGIADQTEKGLNDAFTREMTAYKGLGLNEKQTADLMASVNSRVAGILQADAAFQNQLKAFKSLKSRNPQTVLDYVKSHVDAQTKVALDDIVSTRYSGMRQKPQPRVADPAQTSNGTIKVNKAPDQSEWDLEKMSDLGYDQTAKKGLYYLKGNKTVQLVRA